MNRKVISLFSTISDQTFLYINPFAPTSEHQLLLQNRRFVWWYDVEYTIIYIRCAKKTIIFSLITVGTPY